MAEEKTKWQLLRLEFNARLKRPIKHPEFIIYFIVVICIVGIVGILLTILIERNMTKNIPNHEFSNVHVILSIASYFIALLTSSAVDLILSTKSNSAGEGNPLRKTWIMIGIGTIFLGLIFLGISIAIAEICIFGYIVSFLGLLFAWFIWWITNSVNPNLTDDPDEPLSVFGVVGSPAAGTTAGTMNLTGNLTGIQS